MLIYDPLFHGNTTPLRPMFLGGLLKTLKPTEIPPNKADFHLVPLALSQEKVGDACPTIWGVPTLGKGVAEALELKDALQEPSGEAGSIRSGMATPIVIWQLCAPAILSGSATT